jgi:opacity protein-like surface antigen
MNSLDVKKWVAHSSQGLDYFQQSAISNQQSAISNFELSPLTPFDFFIRPTLFITQGALMKYACILSMTAAILACTQSVAGTMGPAETQKSWTWVGTISAGPVWESAGQTQTFYLAPDIIKTYAASNTAHALADGEIFVGIQKDLPKALQGQIGIAAAVTSNAKLSGNIWDDADSTFNNYSYGYQVQHTHVAVKGKLLADRGYWFIPWVSGSLGVGFNNAHAFQNTPLISQAVTMPNFASNTETSFTYTLGVGLQKVLNPHWQAGVGYEFADWGQSQLNRASGQTLNSGLSLNHFYTNGVLFNLTYLA